MMFQLKIHASQTVVGRSCNGVNWGGSESDSETGVVASFRCVPLFLSKFDVSIRIMNAALSVRKIRVIGKGFILLRHEMTIWTTNSEKEGLGFSQ
jgi:hypothetical protein